MFPFECHVISLARTPHKLTTFMERNAATGLNFRAFEAVDGAALERRECIRNGLIRRGARYANGTLGVASSHRALWSRAVTARTPLLIFEDDVHCRGDILAQLERVIGLIAGWDIVLLGYNTDAVLEVEVLPSCSFGGFFSKPFPSAQDLADFASARSEVTVLPLKNAFGMCSYLVSPEGAEKLLASVFPMDNREVIIPYNKLSSGRDRFRGRTLDTITNTLYRHIGAYTVVPPLALPLNDRSSSSTLGAAQSPATSGPRRAHDSPGGMPSNARAIIRAILRKIRAALGRVARAW
jgi:glycosyl transferase, family 25